MKRSAAAFAKILLVDSGLLVAAIDANDEHHAWATGVMPELTGKVVTFEGSIVEALHRLENALAATDALRVFLDRMEIAPMRPFLTDSVFDLLGIFSPRMDFVDACLVAFARRNPRALVVTTDTRDFSIYRVPFLSPQGLFAN